MQIYIMRHGEALSEMQDPQRRLSPEGRAQIERSAAALKVMGASFDLIISSPKERARETAEIVARTLSYPLNEIEVTDTLNPNVPPEDFIDFLKGFKGRERILAAGHLPSLQNIALWLLCGSCNINMDFRTGTVLRIDTEMLSTRQGVLCWYLSPEQFNIIAEKLKGC